MINLLLYTRSLYNLVYIMEYSSRTCGEAGYEKKIKVRYMYHEKIY